MQQRSDLNRRNMILTSARIVVAGGVILSPNSFGQDSTQEMAKDLIFRTTSPRNGEPELEKLVQNWITPTKHFYVRSHAPNPKIATSDFKLAVDGMVQKTGQLDFQTLTQMPQVTTTATLTCAGNRRAEFNEFAKVGGVQWGPGAIGNAHWTGVPLAAVLKNMGVTNRATHVWFEGLDEIAKGDKIIPFGGSIPIDKAMQESGPGAPLLAMRMNGDSLSPDHGFPLRVVVPGYIGARSVKWLGKITLSDRPSPNHYVATAYKIVKNTKPLDWAESGPIYRFPTNAAASDPKPLAKPSAGIVKVNGYVLPSGRPDTSISSVQLSADDGATWVDAELTGKDQPFCWQLWKANVPVTDATKQLLVRASDTRGGFMPKQVPWNAKGYLQNSWFKLPVKVG